MALDQLGLLGRSTFFRRTVTEGLVLAIPFERYRNHYIFSTLFDTHFLFFLLMALLAIVALYRTVSRFTIPRLLATGILFGMVTGLHIYDGVTLLFIAAGVAAVLWGRGLSGRQALLILVVCGMSVAIAIVWQLRLYQASGLPLPVWRAQSIYFSELALAYALAWGLIAWGLVRYWRAAGIKERFLLGWALGCTVLTLSGPFYPYSDRGALTLQIPLTIDAGIIYFAWRSKVSGRHAVAALVLLGATPLWELERLRRNALFEGHPSGGPPPYTWMSPDHQQVLAALRERAREEDVLIVDKSNVLWRTDDLWLTNGFRGRLYAGHNGLTPDYPRKRDEVNAFYRNPETAAEFLRRARIRFVYVRRNQDPARFERVPGLRPLRSTGVGTLFEYTPVSLPPEAGRR
jgi:hypothetical protein